MGIRRSILTALVVLGGLTCWSAPALALTGHEFSFSFGAFTKPNDIAVDQANGNVFVVDSGANVVKVFGSGAGSPSGIAPSEMTGAEAPRGPFNFGGEPAGVAVDNSGGSSNSDIFVSDVLNHVVDKFGPDGKYICQIRGASQSCLKEPEEEPTFGETTGVSVDTLGNVYVSDYNNSVVDEYNSAGEPAGQISGSGMEHPSGVAADSNGVVYVQQYRGGVFKFIAGSGTLLDPSESFAVGVDGATDEVYVDHGGTIAVYSASGTVLPALEGTFSRSEGVAVSQSTGDVYVSDGAAGRVEAFIPFLYSPPEVGAGEASSITRTTSVVSAAVNTRGLSTECQVVYGTTAGYGSSTTSTTLSTGNGAVALTLTALQPGTTYHYALLATNRAGRGTGPDRTFTTSPPTPPAVATGPAGGVTQTTATITGTVDPRGLPSTYEFQIGPDATYGTQLFGNAGSGQGAEALALELPNLAPAGTYHYRLVARNQDGTSYGADQSFTTPGYPNPLSVPPIPPPVAAIAFLSEPRVTSPKPLTNAQKLAKALKACKKRHGLRRDERARCERQARKKYGAAKRKKKP
jgi:hypothetical protein